MRFHAKALHRSRWVRREALVGCERTLAYGRYEGHGQTGEWSGPGIAVSGLIVKISSGSGCNAFFRGASGAHAKIQYHARLRIEQYPAGRTNPTSSRAPRGASSQNAAASADRCSATETRR